MNRIQTFQGLRGVAIVVIALSHYITALHNLGSIGNSIFLVLSGFLAMYTYRPSTLSRWQDMAHRYLRKFKRTYPPFLVATIIAIPLNLHLLDDSLRIPKVIVYLLQLQSWIPDYSGYGWLILDGPAWFLGTYLFCECMIPILAPFAASVHRRHLAPAAILVSAGILLIVNAGCPWQFCEYFPLVRIFDFFIGMMTCCMAERAIEP